MTDEEAHQLFPALREFVDAVNERDRLTVQAAFMHTEAETLAVLAAGWVGELEDEVAVLRRDLMRQQHETSRFARLAVDSRERVAELRMILDERARSAPKRKVA